MTEAELELLRANCRAAVAETVLDVLYKALQGLDPDFPEFLQRLGRGWVEKNSLKIVMKGQTAEYSDLHAAELRDAIEAQMARLRAV